MPSIVAIDQGTTSCRAIVFDGDGQIVAVAQREFEQFYPRSGWVEHDAHEIWETQAAVLEEVLREAKLQAKDIAGVGITNQRETTVLWNRETGEPIHHAIVWQDRRTADMCARLKSDGAEETFRQKTGLLLDPYFSGTKIAWLLDNVSGARDLAAAGKLAFGTIDTWLIHHLTDGAVHATDPTNAARTLLFNIHTGDWDDELLDILNVPRSVLPEIRPSSGVMAEIAAPGSLKGLPIAGVAGDQQAALFGQACFSPGEAKNTYGTGCFMLMQTGELAPLSQNRLLTTVAWQLGEKTQYALEGSVFVGGAAVQWLRDGLGLIKSASEINELAAQVPDSDGVVFVPALTGLGAPHWDAHARGLCIGISRGTTAAHLARATLEGIALQVADLATAMESDAAQPLTELRADGGAAASDLLMQMQADLMQTSVVRPQQLETTALGAAYLAGLATGVWKNQDELARHWQVDKRFEPKMSQDQAAAKRAQWNRAIERAKDWAGDREA